MNKKLDNLLSVSALAGFVILGLAVADILERLL